MSDAVAVALITVVLGGALTGFFKYIESKANKAQDEVKASAAVVDAANHTVASMRLLMDSQRDEYERRLHECDLKVDKLEHDLLEEKALNVALTGRVEKLSREAAG